MQEIALATAGTVVLAVSVMTSIRRRQFRYQRLELADFNEIRETAKTGDIILFHKTRPRGLIEALEADVVSPLLFGSTEFRHSGIIVKEKDQLFVVECADECHSGHSHAKYLTPGSGIRLVALETLLSEYNRDNGDPHFGIKYIAREIPLATLYDLVEQYPAINYLKMHRTAVVLFAHAFLPKALYHKIVNAYRNEMMCSEFVHSLLAKCKVLKDYPSKLFLPYYIGSAAVFEKLELVKYSDIVRFKYSDRFEKSAALRRSAEVSAAEA